MRYTRAVVVLVSVFIGVCLVSDTYLNVLKEANGYGAHLACTIVFGANRDLQTALDAEFVVPPIKYGRSFDIDKQTKCVSAHFFTWLRQTTVSDRYCFRSEELGCHRVPLKHAAVVNADHSKNFDSDEWSHAEDSLTVSTVNTSCLTSLADEHFAPESWLHSRALLVVHKGELVFERYATDRGFHKGTRLHGWSMTKSFLNALVGIRVKEGGFGPHGLDTTMGDIIQGNKLGIDFSEAVKRQTLRRMLLMSDSLDIDEVYAPGSGVVEMLFRSPSVTKFGMRVGSRTEKVCWEYNSLTTNLISSALAATFSTRAEYLAYPRKALFEPLGMRSAFIETDDENTFVFSSFGWATARDWARFGMLYQDSENPLFPSHWINFSKTAARTSKNQYGAHVWLGGLAAPIVQSEEDEECDALFSKRKTERPDLRSSFPHGSILFKGFEDQLVSISNENVVVRLGATKVAGVNFDKTRFYQRLYQCLGEVTTEGGK